jgi:2,3-diketo-5-methylthio-1-phosphopentane phosphatase
MGLSVFCDFDGTIVHEDVGNAFFRAYGGTEAELAVEGYRSGRLSARECLLAEASAVGHVSRGMLEAFADRQRPDPSFGGFVEYCRSLNAPFTVVSDGLDVYVVRILTSAGFGDLRILTNEAHFDPKTNDGMTVSFPHRDEVCDDCANCKRNHVVTLSGDDDVVVYIGDGLSDRCPVEYADIVFARGSLVAWCQHKNITYHTFRNFAEVKLRLESLGTKGGLKQRREAAMARRALFQRG